MFTIKQIAKGKNEGFLLSFEDENGALHTYEDVKKVSFFGGGMIHFACEETEYILVEGEILSADKIIVHSLHKNSYTLKTGSKFTLFFENNPCFSIDDPSVEWIALRSENEWIVSHKTLFVRYRDGAKIESFSLMEFNLREEK